MLLSIAASPLICDGSKNYARMQKKISCIRSYLEELGFLTKLLYVGLVSTNLPKKNSHKLNVLVTLSRIIRETTVNEMCGYPAQNA